MINSKRKHSYIIILVFLLVLFFVGCGREGTDGSALSNKMAGSLPPASPVGQTNGSASVSTSPQQITETTISIPDSPVSEPPTEPPTELPTEPKAQVEPFVYKGLVELTAVDDSFIIDQRYATTNNFTGVIHYDRVLCLVNQDILPMLIQANNAAKAEGYRIKIWDAYRPISVQQALHDSAPPELSPYVPAPGPYSMHARLCRIVH